MAFGFRHLFTLLVFSMLLWQPTSVHAQMHIDGVTVTIESGTNLYLDQTGLTAQTNGSDGIIDNDGDLYVEGDWTNNVSGGSTFLTSLNDIGTVHFQGGTAQNLGGTESTDFENLTINKSANNVTLGEPITINTHLTLTQGLIIANSTDFPSFINGATSNGGDGDSYVVGPVQKTGNEAFVFPIGDNSYWARLRISAPDDANDAFTAEYTDGAHGDNSTDGSINNVSTVEYWTLTENNDAGASTSISIRLYWEDSARSIIDDYSSDLRVANYNGTNWVDYGHASIYDGGSTGYIESDPQSSFSSLSFGSFSESVNPLPVELISFNASLKGNVVDIDWRTATEINNDYFTVEKSKDGLAFEKVVKVEGAGNNREIKSYSTIDDSPYTGVSYYRLKQTDFDGKFEYSKKVSIEYNPAIEGVTSFIIYPNPAASDQPIFIKAKGFEQSKKVRLLIRDINASTLHSKVINTNDEGSFFTSLNSQEGLTSGMYVLVVISNDQIFHQRKLIIK